MQNHSTIIFENVTHTDLKNNIKVTSISIKFYCKVYDRYYYPILMEPTFKIQSAGNFKAVCILCGGCI